MKPNRRIKKYAESLLTVSKELNCVQETGNGLDIISTLIKQEAVFRTFFNTHRIAPNEKIDVLKSILVDSINSVVFEFIALIAWQNEYQLFMAVAIEYAKLQKAALNQIDVITYSIDKIDEKTISSIITGIEKITDKKVELSAKTDSNLLGGLKLRVGNTIFDGTIVNQMAKMKKVLLQKY